MLTTLILGLGLLGGMLVEGCRILSLSGGGSHGAFEAGVLDNLVNETSWEPWDVYTGVSAGSLGIMSFLKDDYRNNVKKTGELWMETKTGDILEPLASKNSISGNYKIKKLITKAYRELGGKPSPGIFLVGATNLVTGGFYPLEIKTESPNLDYIMASTSIPVVFPPYQEDSEHVYVDGGVQANEFILSSVRYCNPGSSKRVVIDLIFANYEAEDRVVKEYWTIIDIAKRSLDLVKNTFNNMFYKILTGCSKKPDGGVEVNVYMPPFPIEVDSLDFDRGRYMWNLGKHNVTKRTLYC